MTSDLRLDVTDLLRRPGSRRDVALAVPVPGLSAGLVGVPEDRSVRCTVALEGTDDGIVVHGEVTADWQAECARCLEPFDGSATVAVDELFEPRPEEGETYPLEGHEIDLEPLLRDTLLVEFPLAPVPPADADGRCRVCGRLPSEIPYLSTEPRPDPRWAGLDELDL